MFKSKLVPNSNSSNSRNVSLILGIGYGFRLIFSLSLRKSVIYLIVWSFFGMIVDGDCHSELLTRRRTTILHRRWTSNFNVSLFFTGTGYGLQGMAVVLGSFNSILYCIPFHLHSIPSNSCVCMCVFYQNILQNFFCDSVNCMLFSNICSGVTRAYLASRIAIYHRLECFRLLRIFSHGLVHCVMKFENVRVVTLYISSVIIMPKLNQTTTKASSVSDATSTRSNAH